ncbi:hypothetical protein [Rhodopirellula bahusiensis]|uniref:hypothetical protein n=1 Tax=Rhodopirellula bahusiensis TaxID=2014065 RepID=UPI0013046373|nr:hypothetical protein [Rhodopirellula bahusiensis]
MPSITAAFEPIPKDGGVSPLPDESIGDAFNENRLVHCCLPALHARTNEGLSGKQVE